MYLTRLSVFIHESAIDTLVVWFVGAFQKSQDLMEWLVVPVIVAFSLVIGFLNAVFLGIGISTFVFVGSFFRVGIVKFQATGLEIRSRIERSISQNLYLNNRGDEIQVLVLQNYLFFGNAAKLCSYIATMFEEVDETEVDFCVPPVPQVLVVDLSLNTGMDTSTVDIFLDIKEMCSSHDCKLYVTGLSTRMRKALTLGGVKPESSLNPRDRTIRFFPDLDTALGKAEDHMIMLDRSVVDGSSSLHSLSFKGREDASGFQFSLNQIDELHGQDFADGLIDLEPYVESLVLAPGDLLFESDGGIVHEDERGLFFIEQGMIKVSRDPSLTLTINRTRSYGNFGSIGTTGTLGHKHARMGSFAKKVAQVKQQGTDSSKSPRLARIGPGW